MKITSIEQLEQPVHILDSTEKEHLYITHHIHTDPKTPHDVVLITNYENPDRYVSYLAYVNDELKEITTADEYISSVVKEGLSAYEVTFVELKGGNIQ